MKKTVLVLSALVGLSACATTPQDNSSAANNKTFGASLKEALDNSIGAITHATAPNAKGADAAPNTTGGTTQRTRLRDTELNGIISKSSSDGWPRIAVKINTLPKWFYSMPPAGMPGQYTARDCMNISVTVWHDQKRSKTYNNVDFCGDDIVRNTPFSDVGIMWKNFGIISGKNTGAQRTNGPTPPSRLFPNKPGLDSFFHLNGSYYVGSIMATVGYNWKEPQDYRFWVVNVPTQAETVHP